MTTITTIFTNKPIIIPLLTTVIVITILFFFLTNGFDDGYYYTVNGTIKNQLTPTHGIEACYISLPNNSVYGLRYSEDCAKIKVGKNVSMKVYKRFHEPNDTTQWVVGVEVLP